MIEERNTLKIIFFVTFYFNFALSRSIINLYFQRRINLKKKTINQIYHNHCFNEQIANNFVKNGDDQSFPEIRSNDISISVEIRNIDRFDAYRFPRIFDLAASFQTGELPSENNSLLFCLAPLLCPLDAIISSFSLPLVRSRPIFNTKANMKEYSLKIE